MNHGDLPMPNLLLSSPPPLLNVFGFNTHQPLTRRSLVTTQQELELPTKLSSTKQQDQEAASTVDPTVKEGVLDASVKGASGPEDQFDIMIIRGGATGAVSPSEMLQQESSRAP